MGKTNKNDGAIYRQGPARQLGPKWQPFYVKTDGKLTQATIMARDVVETFSNRHYFSNKKSFPMVCHSIRFGS